MKLIYITGAKITSGKANVVQVLSMCNAFIDHGVKVELVSPRINEGIDDPLEYLSNRFGREINIDLSFYPKIELFNRLRLLGAYYGVKKYLNNEDTPQADLYFTRSPLIFSLVAGKGLPVVFEAHNAKMHNKSQVLSNFWTKRVVSNAKADNCLAFITISEQLEKYWNGQGVPQEKMVTLHDGFNDKMFQNPMDKDDARQRLNFPLGKKIVSYSGTLNPDREIENVITLAQIFPGALFIVVGGPQENAEYYKKLALEKGVTNIRFTGPVKHKNIPVYLFASDVLLALWSNKVPTINYCSPLKVFEYMASGRIIVGDAYPTIREVLQDGETALLAAPDSLADLQAKVEKALSMSYPCRMAQKARKLAFDEYSWHVRVNRILDAISIKAGGHT